MNINKRMCSYIECLVPGTTFVWLAPTMAAFPLAHAAKISS